MAVSKQIAKNMFFNVGSFAINLFISFFFTPYLIRTVGKEAYSFFPLANNMIGYTSIITTAVGSMAGRFITICLYKNEKIKAIKYFNSVFVANLILSILFSIIAGFIITDISNILTIPQDITFEVQLLFLFTTGSMIISLISSILGIGCFVRNRTDLYSAGSTLSNILRVCIILFLFAIFSPSIVFMSISAFAASILTFAYNLYLKKKLLPDFLIRPKLYYSWESLKEIISSGIWNSVNQLSVVLLTQLDLLITNLYIGVSATGDYSIAKTIPTLVQSFVGVLVSVFVPHFTILYAKGNQKELIKSINQSIKLMGILVTIPIGFLLINGESFFNLWVPNQNSNTLYWLSNLTIIPMIITGSINTIFNVYTVTNKLKTPAIVLLITGILNTLITVILLSQTNLGLWSIPLTSLIIGLLRNSIFTPIYAAYCLKEKWNIFYLAILKGVIACVIVIAISFLVKFIIPINNWIYFIFNGAIVVIISLGVNSIIFFNKYELRKIIKNKRIKT